MRFLTALILALFLACVVAAKPPQGPKPPQAPPIREDVPNARPAAPATPVVIYSEIPNSCPKEGCEPVEQIQPEPTSRGLFRGLFRTRR